MRNYLVTNHSIQSAGWFKRRKVAAVGFGSHAPRTLDTGPARASRRAASRSSSSPRRRDRQGEEDRKAQTTKTARIARKEERAAGSLHRRGNERRPHRHLDPGCRIITGLPGSDFRPVSV